MDIKKGKQIDAPFKLLVTGPNGIGKSTFAADSPAPIFCPTEPGLDEIDCHRTPRPKTWGEFVAICDWLIREPHDYKTFVIDSVDWLAPLIDAQTCIDQNWTTIEQPFGKGPLMSLSYWRSMIALLDEMRDRRGMNILLIGHVEARRYNDPTTEGGYDRWQLKLPGKAGALLQEWAGAVFYCEFATILARGKRTDTGERVVHTTRSAQWDAKNRYGLPPTMPLSFEAFDEARRDDRTAELDGLLATKSEADQVKVRTWIASQADKKLATARAIERLK